MTPGALIADLRSKGVTLIADGDRLRCRPRSALTSNDLAVLRSNKPAVLAELRAETHPATKKVICYACKTSSFWRSIHGPLVCGHCHPPASPKLVEEWIEPSSGAA